MAFEQLTQVGNFTPRFPGDTGATSKPRAPSARTSPSDVSRFNNSRSVLMLTP